MLCRMIVHPNYVSMPKVDIDKINVFAVLGQMAQSLGGSYSKFRHEAILRLNNINGKGSIRAYEFSDGISCLAYDIEYARELEYIIAEIENRTLYFNYMLHGYFDYKLGERDEWHCVKTNQNIIVESDPSRPTYLRFPKGERLTYLAVNIANNASQFQLGETEATLADRLSSSFSMEPTQQFFRYHGRFSLDILRATEAFFDLGEDSNFLRLQRQGLIYRILGHQLQEYEKHARLSSCGLVPVEFYAGAQKVAHHIENNPETKMLVGTLAEIAGLTKKQLQATFQLLYKRSVMEYVNDQRLEKGKSLLLDTEMHISEIAFILGFSTSSYFSERFKSKFGLSPRDYRRSVSLS